MGEWGGEGVGGVGEFGGVEPFRVLDLSESIGKNMLSYCV